MAYFREVTARQFAAAIEMLEAAIGACPEDLWDDRTGGPPFWHLSYHTLFYLDFYLEDSPETFRPASFHLELSNFLGAVPFPPFRVETPATAFSREQLLEYLAHGRERCSRKIAGLEEESARRRCGFPWLDLSAGELMLYNLRHVQHHAAQLNLLLRQRTGSAPAWVGRVGLNLS
jgi:hypothetical protein